MRGEKISSKRTIDQSSIKKSVISTRVETILDLYAYMYTGKLVTANSTENLIELNKVQFKSLKVRTEEDPSIESYFNITSKLYSRPT